MLKSFMLKIQYLLYKIFFKLKFRIKLNLFLIENILFCSEGKHLEITLQNTTCSFSTRATILTKQVAGR